MSIASVSATLSPAQLAAQLAAAKAKTDSDSAQVLQAEKQQGGIELTGAALQKAKGFTA